MRARGKRRRCQQGVPRPTWSNGDGLSANVLISGLQSPSRHDVHTPTQQLFQLILEMEKVKERASRFKLDEEVDVTVRVILTAGYRTKERNGMSAVATRGSADRVPLIADQFVNGRRQAVHVAIRLNKPVRGARP